jgi:hypothetical protein
MTGVFPLHPQYDAVLLATIGTKDEFGFLAQYSLTELSGRIPRTSDNRTEDLSRFNRNFARDERRDRASYRRRETTA